MSDTAWISTAPGHASNMRPFNYSFNGTDLPDIAMEWGQRNVDGQSLNGDCFPDEIYGAGNAEAKDYKLPDIFFAGSYWVVSSAAAEVLRQFDLGGGALYPVQVFKKDRETPIGEGWFCINFGNQKNVLFPQESPRMRHRYIRNGEKGWFPPFVTKDGDVAVSSAALRGPDLWIDPNVGDAFFLSDALAKALKKAKVDKGFFLSKCRGYGDSAFNSCI
jgi:hypothetical protein